MRTSTRNKYWPAAALMIVGGSAIVAAAERLYGMGPFFVPMLLLAFWLPAYWFMDRGRK